MLFLSVYCCFFYFFFFQAEDGIRDYKVTGVQTCALPIWRVRRRHRPAGCSRLEFTTWRGDRVHYGILWGRPPVGVPSGPGRLVPPPGTTGSAPCKARAGRWGPPHHEYSLFRLPRTASCPRGPADRAAGDPIGPPRRWPPTPAPGSPGWPPTPSRQPPVPRTQATETARKTGSAPADKR